MSTLTVQLPESLAKSIEALAAQKGYTVSQFLASAARHPPWAGELWVNSG